MYTGKWVDFSLDQIVVLSFFLFAKCCAFGGFYLSRRRFLLPLGRVLEWSFGWFKASPGADGSGGGIALGTIPTPCPFPSPRGG